MTSTNENNCPVCGSSIPDEAPNGLCPQCVFQNAETIANYANTGGRVAPHLTVEEIAPHFPNLEIIEFIGAGGMGAVYKARQPKLDRTVALKILSRELAEEPAFVERFNREARMLARLSHPNIVGIYEFGSNGPFCYLLMEYIDGVNLRQAMRTGGFTPKEALTLVQEVCAALQFAHEEGILHRDIKPENVLIDSKGRVKIADFGIAKMMGERATADFTLTMQGSIVGSPHYMAPEQIETPDDVDQRADIYSLGVVLYEMLTGGLPIGRFALPSQKGEMDARIDEIVLRTLEKERHARFQSAEEVRTSVDALAQGPPILPKATIVETAERSVAKFSFASALSTGFSLMVAVVVCLVIPLLGDIPGLPVLHIGFLLIVIIALPALFGFIFGCKALGDIHESGGRKRGVGLASFGSLAWPIFLFLALGVVAIVTEPLGSLDDELFLYYASAVGGVIGSIVLFSGISHWAQGIRANDRPSLLRRFSRWMGVRVRVRGRRAGSDPNRTRVYPKLFGTITLALLLSIGCPILGSMGIIKLIKEQREEMHRESRPEANVVEGDVDWYRGGPEAIVDLRVHPAVRAGFSLVQYDIDENPVKIVQIATWTPPSKPVRLVREADPCLVKVGTTAPKSDPGGPVGVAVLLAHGGKSGSFHSGTDFSVWRFQSTDEPGEWPLMGGKESYTIATREEEVNGEMKVTGSLKLEVSLTER